MKIHQKKRWASLCALVLAAALLFGCGQTAASGSAAAEPTATAAVMKKGSWTGSELAQAGKLLGRSACSSTGALQLSMSASGVEWNAYCKGAVSVTLGWSGILGMLAVTVDGEEQYLTLRPNTGTAGADNGVIRSRFSQTIVLAWNLEEGEHTFRIQKANECSSNLVSIQSVQMEGYFTQAPAESDLYMEFWGDSLSCGNSNLVTEETQGDTPFGCNEDAMQAFAAICAETLGADYGIVARSGIGLYREMHGDLELTVPNIVDKALLDYGNATWDIAAHAPDIVVINLGTNDTTAANNQDLPDTEESLAGEWEAAQKLISTARMANPDCTIIWVSGMMGKIKPSLRQLYAKLAAEDDNMYFWEDFATGQSGGYGHPDVAEHTQVGKKLAARIQQVLDGTYDGSADVTLDQVERDIAQSATPAPTATRAPTATPAPTATAAPTPTQAPAQETPTAAPPASEPAVSQAPVQPEPTEQPQASSETQAASAA